MKRIIFILGIISVFHEHLNAQDTQYDTSQVEVDTIVVYQAPLVINKTIYVKNKALLQPIHNRIEVFVSGGEVINYYNPCTYCKTFVDTLKASKKGSQEYSVGIGYSRIMEKWYTGFSGSFTNSLEKYDYSKKVNCQDCQGERSYRYADFSLTSGLLLGKQKIRYIPYLGFVYSRLSSISGKILNKADGLSLIPVQDQMSYNKNLYSISAGLKINYYFSTKTGIIFEPYYRGNISSVTLTKGIYSQQRNSISLKLGLFTSF